MHIFVGVVLIVVAGFSYYAVNSVLVEHVGPKLKLWWFVPCLALACGSFLVGVVGVEFWRNHLRYSTLNDQVMLANEGHVTVNEKVTKLADHDFGGGYGNTDTTWMVKLISQSPLLASSRVLWLVVDGQNYRRIKIGAAANYKQGVLRFDTMVTGWERYSPFISDTCSATAAERP